MGPLAPGFFLFPTITHYRMLTGTQDLCHLSPSEHAIWFISQSLLTLVIPASLIEPPGRSKDTAGRSLRLQFKHYEPEGLIFGASHNLLLQEERPPPGL